MYRDWREGQIKPLPPEFPSLNDPYFHPKMLGWGAYFGALVAGIFTVPVALFIRSPVVAWLIIGAIWTIFFALQIRGWHRYFFRVRPAQRGLIESKAKNEEAKASLAELLAKHAIEKEARDAALEDYRSAVGEGMDALRALGSQTRNSSDRKRHIRAQLDFLKAQSLANDEPDLAKRFKLQAEAMRRETRLIKAIRFSF